MISSESIRFATEKDCTEILQIYTPYVLETSISFEIEPPSLEDFTNKFSTTIKQYPWLVLEQNGEILGYAYGASHRSRCAYSWSCEVSVYVDKNHHRKGIGTYLYKALFPFLKAQGFYNLFAGVTQPNEGSDKIHTQLGFNKIGTYKNIGYKKSKWHDVSWYQLELNSEGEPKSPVSPSMLLTEQTHISSLDPNNNTATQYIHSLDGYLNNLYPPEENHLDAPEDLSIGNSKMIGVHAGELLVGIGAIKFFESYAEVKRMWVPPLYRGFGISKKILSNLEALAFEKGFRVLRLETGSRQERALNLYQNSGYIEIQPFGSYTTNSSSIFMEKRL